MMKLGPDTLREFVKDMTNPKNKMHELRSKWENTRGLYKLLKKNIPALQVFGLRVADIEEYIHIRPPSPGTGALYIYPTDEVWV